MDMLRPRFPVLQAAAAVVLACLCAEAGAVDGLDRARQRGKLIAGIDYVVPEYKGGMKYRTPETIDRALLDDVARRLQLPLATVAAKPGRPAALLSAGEADLALSTVSAADPLRRTFAAIPTGYTAGPMAIMRSDTDIKAWQQLKGRKVCVSEGGRYVGTLAAHYGAVEIVHKAPADALLALRTGACDATVHDNALLEELIRLPEWKKFSAHLPVGPRLTQVFVVPAKDRTTAAFLVRTAREWAAHGHVHQLVKKAVQNIAFEVYLDQDVPDCH